MKQISDCEGRLAAFTEAVKIIERKDHDPELRRNSRMEQVREFLRASGKPVALSEILKAIGASEDDEKLKNSLRGSLAGYAREQRVFTKEDEPDTFGLLEFKRQQIAENDNESRPLA
jgi:hypothetical protein